MLGVALVLSSCASVYVATDYDRQADFSAYKSFAFFKEGVDKVTDNKNVVLISVVSSVIAALVVVAVLSFFFGKKEKKFFR